MRENRNGTMNEEGNYCCQDLVFFFPGSQRSSVQGQVFAVMKEKRDVHLCQVHLFLLCSTLSSSLSADLLAALPVLFVLPVEVFAVQQYEGQ